MACFETAPDRFLFLELFPGNFAEKPASLQKRMMELP